MFWGMRRATAGAGEDNHTGKGTLESAEIATAALRAE